jgi:hypothetical protein
MISSKISTGQSATAGSTPPTKTSPRRQAGLQNVLDARELPEEMKEPSMTRPRRSLDRMTWPIGLLLAAIGLLFPATAGLAAPQGEPATAAAARKVLDLATFPLPEGAVAREPRRLANLDYFTAIKPAAAYAQAKAALEQAGWNELPGSYASDEYANGTFAKDAFCLSLSSSPGQNPDGQPATLVHLSQHGNVDLETIPKPADLAKLYAGPVSAIYVSERTVAETTDQCVAALVKAGWEKYSDDTQPMFFKKNAVRLTLFVVTAPAQQDKTSVTYGAELMSVELAPPPEMTRNNYADNLTGIHFDTKLSIDDTIKFYRQHLASLGWKATTDNPIKIDLYETLIFRNKADDLLTLSLDDVENGLIRGSLIHQTAAEVAAEEEMARQAAEEKANSQAAMERERAANKLAVPLPKNASEVEVSDSRIEFQLPSGKSATPLKDLRKFLTDAGWKEETVSDDPSASVFNYTKGDARLDLTSVDPGFIPAEVSLSASGVTLQKK